MMLILGYGRKNWNVHPAEKHIHYAIYRAYSEYELGYISREKYVMIVDYIMRDGK